VFRTLSFSSLFFNMSAAQDEFNALIQANKDSQRGHPEDRSASPASAEEDQTTTGEDQYELSDADSDYADYHRETSTKGGAMVSRTAAYTVPSTVFDANTGPKGVIADAQSFERARKKSFRRTLMSVAGLDSNSKLFGFSNGNGNTGNNISSPGQASSQGSSSDEDEDFMRRWRESRLQELQDRNQRRPSPSKRVYGRVDTVDAEGYLNAIERVASDTVVVVCIYDPEVCPIAPPLISRQVIDLYSHQSAPRSRMPLKSLRADRARRASSNCTTKLPR
jgi:hypothetical protein